MSQIKMKLKKDKGGTERYREKVVVIDSLISCKISLKREHDILREQRSIHLKQGKKVSNQNKIVVTLRGQLDDIEDKLVAIYEA